MLTSDSTTSCYGVLTGLLVERLVQRCLKTGKKKLAAFQHRLVPPFTLFFISTTCLRYLPYSLSLRHAFVINLQPTTNSFPSTAFKSSTANNDSWNEDGGGGFGSSSGGGFGSGGFNSEGGGGGWRPGGRGRGVTKKGEWISTG